MRDAVGGSFLFYIILGFLAVFVIFTAVIMNYAAAYRASNYVLTMLERTEGNVPCGGQNLSVAGDGSLYGYLKERTYYNSLEVYCTNIPVDSNTTYSIYKIRTIVDFDLPLLGVSLKLPINNETKTIYAPCNANYLDRLNACQ